MLDKFLIFLAAVMTIAVLALVVMIFTASQTNRETRAALYRECLVTQQVIANAHWGLACITLPACEIAR